MEIQSGATRTSLENAPTALSHPSNPSTSRVPEEPNFTDLDDPIIDDAVFDQLSAGAVQNDDIDLEDDAISLQIDIACDQSPKRIRLDQGSDLKIWRLNEIKECSKNR